MNSVFFGLLSAAGLGTADFMARFSSRALGPPLTYAVVLLVGTVASTIWIACSGHHFVWSPLGCALAVLHGFSVTGMCMLLYAGLARGPVAIVAPIVAAHPAFVLVVNVLMGLRPNLLQWAAMATVMVGGVLIARSAESHPQFAVGDRSESRKTLAIAFGACLAHVILVITGQAAVPIIGEVQTLWIGRLAGLLLIACILGVHRPSVAVDASWLLFVGVQAIFDLAGYAAFLAGAKSSSPAIVMVIASTFSVVTVVLAKFILKEPISWQQWLAIILVVVGTATLAGSV